MRFKARSLQLKRARSYIEPAEPKRGLNRTAAFVGDDIAFGVGFYPGWDSDEYRRSMNQ